MATLHMMCGKMGSGKSTLAKELMGDNAVLISEDAWLGTLFADELKTGRDFLRCSAKLRAAMGPHIAALLRAGLTVVLDFQANTVESRTWMRGLIDATNADHQMHVLTTSDEVCLARLRDRNARGEHPFAPSEEMFHQFSKHYVPPTPDEGFTVVTHP